MEVFHLHVFQIVLEETLVDTSCSTRPRLNTTTRSAMSNASSCAGQRPSCVRQPTAHAASSKLTSCQPWSGTPRRPSTLPDAHQHVGNLQAAQVTLTTGSAAVQDAHGRPAGCATPCVFGARGQVSGQGPTHLVVGDEDGGDADAVDNLLQPGAQALADLRIQRPERLVQQQQPALAGGAWGPGQTARSVRVRLLSAARRGSVLSVTGQQVKGRASVCGRPLRISRPELQ